MVVDVSYFSRRSRAVTGLVTPGASCEQFGNETALAPGWRCEARHTTIAA